MFSLHAHVAGGARFLTQFSPARVASPLPMLHRSHTVDTIARPAVEPLSRANHRIVEILLFARDILVGAAAASFAVGIRYLFDLPIGILPFFTVIIAVCLTTVTTGIWGGISAAITGGLLGWYLFLEPHSWRLQGAEFYSLMGYFAVITVILCTSQLYRMSERERQAAALALALQEAEHQALFAREMSHRLKNAMAIVQAMALQTFARDNPELPKFDGRLRALADAHNLLNEHVSRPSASVREIVETAIRPFSDGGSRFALSGPDATIPDQQVVSLALALHELSTNAVKYGALSTPEGKVTIDWAVAGGKLRLAWKEHDGPKVAKPKSGGFGTRLLGRAAMGAEVQYEPDGVRCVISQRL